MANHLGYEKHANEASQFSNSRNGKTTKTVRRKLGELSIEVPWDREGTFKTQGVPKRKRILQEIEDHVLTLHPWHEHTRHRKRYKRDLWC